MRRRFFTIASVISLLLCAATVALWLRSYAVYRGLSLVDDSRPDDARWREWFIYQGKTGTVAVRYDAGMTNVETFGFWGKHRRFGRSHEPPIFVSGAIDEAEAGRADWQFGGFSSIDDHGGFRAILFPLWAVAGAFCFLPTFAMVIAVKRRLRIRAGHCFVCSYNLAGNSSGVCPECGTPISRKAEATA